MLDSTSQAAEWRAQPDFSEQLQSLIQARGIKRPVAGNVPVVPHSAPHELVQALPPEVEMCRQPEHMVFDQQEVGSVLG